MVGGVPIGRDDFVHRVLLEKAQEVVTYIEQTAIRLADHPHALWSAVYYCCASRFDYWLRHVVPFHSRPVVLLVDQALLQVAEQLTYQGCFGDPITLRRLRLAARDRGCGLRSRVALAPIAYTACFIEAASRFLDRAPVTGGPRSLRGYFPSLEQTFGTGAFDHGGLRFTQYLQSGSQPAQDFRSEWEDLQDRIGDSGISGPLDDSAALAGSQAGSHFQHAITVQIESVQRAQLHRDIMELPRHDTRRQAWLAVDRLSSQFVHSFPTHHLELGQLDFPEALTTYLGRESPHIRALAGRTIPCGWTCRAGGSGPRISDAYGHQLGLATLPGDDDTICHDTIGRELFHLISAAGLRTELSPWHIFTSLVPIARLQAAATARDHRGRPGIIPDAAIDVELRAVADGYERRYGPSLGFRRLLFDVKTIRAGTQHYRVGIATTQQSAAVRHRELQVWPAYQRHARRLDQTFFDQTGTTPFLDRLRSFSQTRGLVFGAYGEASADVHALLEIAATSQAERLHGRMGARSMSEMRACLISRMRRQIGLVTVRAMARHRLARAPYIGVERRSVEMRAELLRREQLSIHTTRAQSGGLPVHAFYSYQAFHSRGWTARDGGGG